MAETERGRRLLVGTAGWAIPRAVAAEFPAGGSALSRYAARFGAAEINSSFHRPHRPATYAGWAAATPDDFRFSAKLPKTITHELRLGGAEAELDRFLGEVASLGPKLGPLVIQLPPSLPFDHAVAQGFLTFVRSRHRGVLVCEPRHPSWFDIEADRLLQAHEVARVVADPARVPAAATPGGWGGFVYIRLHGSPQMYRSSYGTGYLDALAERLRGSTVPTWCMFDNTASGAACANALELVRWVADE